MESKAGSVKAATRHESKRMSMRQVEGWLLCRRFKRHMLDEGSWRWWQLHVTAQN